MLARIVLTLLVVTGCTPYIAPNLSTPAVVKREHAARLLILVAAAQDPDRSGAWDAVINRVADAIEDDLREASFRVTREADARAPVKVTVGRPRGEGILHVVTVGNSEVLDRFSLYSGRYNASDLREMAKHARERLERLDAVAALGAAAAPSPHVAKADQARSWTGANAVATATRRLAVLEFRGSLAPNLLALLSDQARSAAVEAVRPHGIAVMTRENTAVMLKDQGKTAVCAEGECEVETARLIGAHLVVTGEVSRVGNAQFLQMKLFDAEAGTLLASKQADATDDLALVKAAKPAAAALFE
jgi:hypothetical protein